MLLSNSVNQQILMQSQQIRQKNLSGFQIRILHRPDALHVA